MLFTPFRAGLNSFWRNIFSLFLLVMLSAWAGAARADSPSSRPNVIVILSDDVGYGDVVCDGGTQITTPNIDALAAGGLRFTDGHCTASTCTPSRYSLITGRYAFRDPKAKILPGDAPLLIAPGSPTLPAMMKKAGYTTGFVGKWHLGLGNGQIDWNGIVAPGPDEIGFDYSFFLPATPDRVPCVYIENHQVDGLTPSDPLSVSYEHKIGDDPTGAERPDLLRYQVHGTEHSGTIVNHISRIGFMEGGHSAWWIDEEMAQRFLSKTENFIERNKDKPFFLYYAPHNIHVPRAPNGQFLHTSQCGIRGDDIEELDSVIGGLTATLKRLDLTRKTLIIFSSDNGPIFNDGYADGAVKEANGHMPAGPYRGGKYQIYEGGTRVPFIVSWPGKVAPGVSNAMVSQLDLYASLADLVGQSHDAALRPDSQDVLPALLGKSPTGRQTMVEQGLGETLALREGPWKFIPAHKPYKTWRLEEGDVTVGPPDVPYLQLFNLDSDPGETKNVAAQHPDIVKEMSAQLQKEEAAQ